MLAYSPAAGRKSISMLTPANTPATLFEGYHAYMRAHA